MEVTTSSTGPCICSWTSAACRPDSFRPDLRGTDRTGPGDGAFGRRQGGDLHLGYQFPANHGWVRLSARGRRGSPSANPEPLAVPSDLGSRWSGMEFPVQAMPLLRCRIRASSARWLCAIRRARCWRRSSRSISMGFPERRLGLAGQRLSARTVVLSFEQRVWVSGSAIDNVSVKDGANTEFVVNGDFEAAEHGLDGFGLEDRAERAHRRENPSTDSRCSARSIRNPTCCGAHDRRLPAACHRRAYRCRGVLRDQPRLRQRGHRPFLPRRAQRGKRWQ